MPQRYLTFLERLDTAVGAFLAALGAAVAGGIVWFIRTVFTNHRKVDILIAEAKARAEHRETDREALAEIRSDIREVKDDIRGLWKTVSRGDDHG